ncbi:hypothetical protein JW948_11375 [bacterium]|nr:hypothetical protein [bacterium]
MLDPVPEFLIPCLFAGLSLFRLSVWLSRGRWQMPEALQLIWIFSLIISVAEYLSFHWALWMLALYAFFALREFFSLVDIRIEDRFGILFAYLSIPFMFYLIHILWYGLFIISIPVYTYLLVPFFVAAGRKTEGIVFSTGVIDFGLFFYVLCMGHIAYLIYFSERMAALMIAAAVISGVVLKVLIRRPFVIRYGILVVLIGCLYVLSSSWSGIPWYHCIALGGLVPLLTCVGHFTLNKIEDDLGIRADRLQPGRGRMIHSMRLILFTAPVMFHYLRWFLHWGDIQ